MWGITELEKLKAKLKERALENQLAQRIEDALEATPVENEASAAILPDMNNNLKLSAYAKGVQSVMEKNGLSMYDLLGLLPGGSLIEGAIKPSEGASRAETMALGGGGGLIGTALGGLAGAAATSELTGEEPDQQLMFSLPAAGAGAIGGGAIGNIIGRWLAERKSSPETDKLEELKTILEQSRQPGNSVNINMDKGEQTPLEQTIEQHVHQPVNQSVDRPSELEQAVEQVAKEEPVKEEPKEEPVKEEPKEEPVKEEPKAPAEKPKTKHKVKHESQEEKTHGRQ